MTLYAIVYESKDKFTLGPLCKTAECADISVSPFEGAHVIGRATVEMLEEPVMGMHFALERAK
jgi:hypothetical protein